MAQRIAWFAMADDTTGWSEKRKGARGAGERSGESTTPPRPSKRAASTSSEAESSVVRRPSADAGARKVAKAAATAGQRDVAFVSRLGFPALIALICLLGIGVVVYARSTREALASPVQNLDHWHGVYGVYSCNITDGDKYLPPFQSTQDDTGIHSHGDGLMHIHPFFELSSGDNATLERWMAEMNIEITPEAITVNNVYDPPVQLAAGQPCADGTGIAEIKLLRWEYDFQAQAEDRPDPEVITENFGDVHFDHDREVYLFAYVSEDTDIADIPIPPAERFDTLNNVSAAIDYNPTELQPIETDDDTDDAGDADTDDADTSGDAGDTDLDAEVDE